jgi:uncharacterized protein (TIGR00290 family)
MTKAVLFWSGGKDSSLCLHKVLQEDLFDVQYLLTTVNSNFKRISMHGVREELLDLQAASIDIPLLKMYVNEGSNEEYETVMQQTLSGLASEGINHVIFGDIFLEDLRVYRENNLAKLNMKAVFPLWKQDTATLIQKFMAGFKTITCCTNDGYLGEEWVGRKIDAVFVNELPPNVDPCGENGEYHTFCYDGPIFKTPVKFEIGEKLYKPLKIKTAHMDSDSVQTKGFWFIDLIPL